MLESVQVKRLRGIREGKLEGLTRLTVIVGRNGSGKSSLLEACLIGAGVLPALAAGIAVQSRQQYNGARWLIQRGGNGEPAEVGVTLSDGTQIERHLHWDSQLAIEVITRNLTGRGAPRPYSQLRILRRNPPLEPLVDVQRGVAVDRASFVGIAADNQFEPLDAEGVDPKGSPILLLRPQFIQSLHDLYSRALELGRKHDVLEHAQALIPDLRELDILTESGAPWLALSLPDGPVPAALAGDGVQAALRIVLQLAAQQSGSVLIEEPEAHQHPASLARVTLAIVSAVRRGLQVILTTHSLELIDHLLGHLKDEEVADEGLLSVVRVRLDHGRLASSTSNAKQAEQARVEIQEDLR